MYLGSLAVAMEPTLWEALTRRDAQAFGAGSGSAPLPDKAAKNAKVMSTVRTRNVNHGIQPYSTKEWYGRKVSDDKLIRVPFESLPAQTLDALIEAFILQEGTDYGALEVGLPARVAQVRRQIEKKEVFVVFHAESETCTLATARQLTK